MIQIKHLLLATTLVAAPALAQTMSPARPAAPAQPMTPAPTTATPATAAPTTPATPASPATAAAAAPAAPATAPAAAPTMTIAAALPTLPNHATLLKLVTAADLLPTLSGPGPFTLLAPNDAAFARLPAGTLDTLLAPAAVASLTTILKNHLIAGAMTEADFKARIAAGGGTATLMTMSGQPLIASMENGSVLLTDAVGNKSYIDKENIRETNGIIQGTNGISLPKLG